MASGVGRVSDVVIPFSSPMTVAADPGAPAVTTQPSITVQGGGRNASFFANDGNATGAMNVSRQWFVDGVLVGRGRRIAPSIPGSLTLTVTFTDGQGRTVSATSAAVVISAGVGPIVTPTPSPTPSPTPTPTPTPTPSPTPTPTPALGAFFVDPFFTDGMFARA